MHKSKHSWISSGLVLVVVFYAVAGRAATSGCPVTRQELLIARAHLACRLSPDLPICAGALLTSNLFKGDELSHGSNEELQQAAAFAEANGSGLLALTMAQWAGERARLIQPRIRKEKLTLFINQLPAPKESLAMSDLAAREGLGQLIAQTSGEDLAIPDATFWIRNIAFEPSMLKVLFDPKLTENQRQVLTVLLADEGQVRELQDELQLMHWSAEDVQSTFWTRTVLTRIGEVLFRVAKRTAMSTGSSVAEYWGHESVVALGTELADRFMQTTMRAVSSHAATRVLSLPLLSLYRSRAARYVGGKALGFLLESFEPPGLAFSTIEMAMEVEPTACSTLDRAAVPVNDRCEIRPEEETHPNVLRFLDAVVSKNNQSSLEAQTYLEFPETCRFYQEMAAKVVEQSELRSLSCKETEVQAHFAARGETYSLAIALYPATSRNPHGIRQVVVKAANGFTSNQNRSANFTYNIDGTQSAASVNGLDEDLAAATRVAALRATAGCSRRREHALN